MTQNPKKAAKLTTEQAIRRLFPKPVIEGVRRAINPEEGMAGGPGVSEEPRPKSSMKRQ